MRAGSALDGYRLQKRAEVCIILKVDDDTLRKMIGCGLFPQPDIIEPNGGHKWLEGTIIEHIKGRLRKETDRDSERCETCLGVDDGVCPTCNP